MKHIATERIINHWLSHINFHFQIPNPIDNSYALEIYAAKPSQRAEILGGLVKLIDEISAHEPETSTLDSYTRIRKEASQQIIGHINVEQYIQELDFRPIVDNNELNRILGELHTKTMQYAYDDNIQKYRATTSDIGNKFLMLAVEELLLPKGSVACLDGELIASESGHVLADLLALAEQGDVASQHNLGNIYWNGIDVPQDIPAALKWYTLAAEQGSSVAQSNLGVAYDQGIGVPRSAATAIKWHTLAAEQGEGASQHSLGVMCANGEGTPQDYKSAIKWYNLAAEQGISDAQYNLGYMYATGSGVVIDYRLAYMWWNLADYNGNKDAGESRDAVAGRMTLADISKAQDMYARCLESGYTSS